MTTIAHKQHQYSPQPQTYHPSNSHLQPHPHPSSQPPLHRSQHVPVVAPLSHSHSHSKQAISSSSSSQSSQQQQFGAPPKVLSMAEQKEVVNKFCVAKIKIDRIEEDFSQKRRALQESLDKVKDELKKIVQDAKVSCWTVTVTDEKTGEQLKRYIRSKQTFTIGTLSDVNIGKAIRDITAEDLKFHYAILREKQTKVQPKKRKRGADEPAAAPEPPKITILDVWEAVALVKIREAHLRPSYPFELDSSCQRGKIPPQAPEKAAKLAQEWFTLSQQIASLSETKKTSVTVYEEKIAAHEPIVTQYLQQVRPIDKCQEVMLNVHGNNKPHVLREKETVVRAPVRIRAFQPYIRRSLEETFHKHAAEVQNLSSACSDSIKNDLVKHLTQYYKAVREQGAKPKTYVSLDRVAIKS